VEPPFRSRYAALVVIYAPLETTSLQLLRTLVQIARECRNIDAAGATSVLTVIDQRSDKWKIDLPALLRERMSLRDLARFTRFQLTLRQIRRNLSRAQ
jgi:hypothetical protein